MKHDEVCKLKHTNRELVKIISEFVIDNIVHVLDSYTYIVPQIVTSFYVGLFTFKINFHNS